jgi:type II secretion system protein J
LLELLIAMSIFAVVLLAINGVFYAAIRLQRTSARSMEAAVPLQQTLAILKRDLEGIVSPGGALAGPLQPSSASTNSTDMLPQGGGSSAGMGQQGSTIFYTCTGTIDDTSTFGDIQKIAYYLKSAASPTSGGKDLVRVVSRNLLATNPEQSPEQWLMSGVEQFQFSFFDGATWRDTWDSTVPDPTTGQTNSMPSAIKVQIDLAPRLGEPRQAPLQLLVPVVVQAPTNQVASNSGGQQQ